MSGRIKIAKTTAEIDELLRLRHQTFVSEKHYMAPSPDGRLIDAFDAFPTTVNIIALVDGRVVAGIRFIEPSSAGFPADAYFDFGPHLPPPPARVGAGSMLCIDPEYRQTPRLAFSMMAMGYYWATTRKLSHILGVSAPDAEHVFLGTGFQALSPRFFHEPTQLWAMPVMLDIARLNDRFLNFIARHQIEYFVDSFERQFHQAGDVVFRAGDEGDAAYLVVSGTLEVRVARDGVAVAVGQLGPGDLFGEVALLTSRSRTASVVALDDADLMVIEREVLESQLLRRPEMAMHLLRVLSNRLADATENRRY